MSALAVCLVVGTTPLSHADSGGSFGGSSFGSSGGGTSSPGSSGASRTTVPITTTQRTHVRTGESPGPAPVRSTNRGDSSRSGKLGPLVVFGGFFGIFALLVFLGKRKGKGAHVTYDVAVYRFGVDGSLTQLRTRLEDLAKTADMSSFTGRSATLNTISVELQRNAVSVFFADVQAWERLEGATAEQQFHQRAMQARSKFSRETIRADSTGVRQQQKNVALGGELLDEDGDFLMNEIFVLTLVLATATEVEHPPAIANHEQLRDSLMAAGTIPATSLIGLEVIWSPSADSDTMTVDEMQLTYPRLMRL